MDDRLLTILQATRQFNLTGGLLYAAVARGELVAIRFHPKGRIRLREIDVRLWIDGHASATRQPLRVGFPHGQPPAVTGIEQLLPPKESRRFAG